MQTGTEADVDEIGFFGPQMTPVDALRAGEVGYLITGIKDVSLLRVGDTLTTKAGAAAEPLPGYREVKPMVFCGLFPVDTDQFPDLRDALEKLSLNDAALSYEPETSEALGFGFRCGFLGLLHMDIVRERLEREYDLELLATDAERRVRGELTDGSEVVVHSPADMPDRAVIAEIREPYIRATILCPKEHVGAVMELCQERRGTHVGMTFLSGAGAAPVRPAAGGDRARLLRPAEVAHEGLRVARLRAARPARGRPREARHPAGGRQGRRALDGRPPRQGLPGRAARSPSGCRSRSRASSSRWRSRRRSAPRSSPASR